MSVQHSRNPVQLWNGEPAQLRDEVLRFAQEVTAPCKGCRFCHACRAITQRQWAQLVWVTPGSHGHTRELLDDGLAPLAFATDLPHVLVIEHAELLLPATAHRLLKPLEEPPLGWHIILLTDRPALIINTVRSRCVARNFVQESTERPLLPTQAHPTIAWLKDPRPEAFIAACNAIDTLPKTPTESVQLWEEVVAFWHTRWVESPQDTRIKQRYLQLIAAGATLPPAGSTMRFWRLIVISFLKAI